MKYVTSPYSRYVIFTLSPGEECEGNASHFGSVSLTTSLRTTNLKYIGPIDLIIYTRSIMPVARWTSTMNRIGIRTQEFI